MKQVTHSVYGFKPTEENWYGNFYIAGDLSHATSFVRVSKTRYSDGSIQVAVWGNDDFGLERHSHNPDGSREWSNDAQDCLFDALMSSVSISQESCVEGFGMVSV